VGEIRRRDFLRGLALAASASLPGGKASRRARAAFRRPGRLQEDFFQAVNAVGRVTFESAVVNLVTSDALAAPLHARVRWAEDEAQLDSSVDVSAPVAAEGPGERLELTLAGLSPAREYFYRVEVESEDAPGEWHVLPSGRFRTQKPPGEGFAFALVADPHWGHWEFDFDLATVWGYSARACLSHLAACADADFCVDLGDSAYLIDVTAESQAHWHYREYRRVMATVLERMALYYVLGNHEQEAGFYQHGDDGTISHSEFGNNLSQTQYQQKWATRARLTFVPNPRGDTYPEGGEGAPGYDSSADWGAGTDPWNDGERSHIQNFYAWTWGDALFVALDPYRYTLVGGFRRPTSPVQWTLGPTQMRWLEDTLASSDARWKFLFAHHQVGGGLINAHGNTIEEWNGLAYGRGSAIEAARPDTEQAAIHALMRSRGAQFFVYGHDHCFCHSVLDGIHYLACARPSFLNPWFGRPGMRASYGDVLTQGADLPWIKRLFTTLGYTRFRVNPGAVTVEWIRTGYSFQPNVIPCFEMDLPGRDWIESWPGRAYAVSSPDRVEVTHVPVDVDGVRTAEGAQIPELHTPPTGEDFYIQPIPTRPESYDQPAIPLEDYPAAEHPVAVVDCVPETLYTRVWEQSEAGIDEVDGPPTICGLSLTPNPARGPVRIAFTAQATLPGAHLRIHDCQGRLVYVRPLGCLRGGRYAVVWDGRTSTGDPAARGVYVVAVRWKGGAGTHRKLTLLD